MFNSDNQSEGWVVMQNGVTHTQTDTQTQPFIVKDSGGNCVSCGSLDLNS